MYTVERREVSTILNYRNRPKMSKRTYWFVLKNGQPVERDSCGYIQPGGIYFVHKRDAVDEAIALQNKEGVQ